MPMPDLMPDDRAVRRSQMGTLLALGTAVCPECFKAHTKCGLEHLRQPWAVEPRCIDCGAPLVMPEHQIAALGVGSR